MKRTQEEFEGKKAKEQRKAKTAKADCADVSDH